MRKRGTRQYEDEPEYITVDGVGSCTSGESTGKAKTEQIGFIRNDKTHKDKGRKARGRKPRK